MSKPYAEQGPDGLWNIPAADRNKGPILEALRGRLPALGLVLEIASGTGQHVAHFARELGALTWMPSDPDAGFRRTIENRIRAEALTNVRVPLDLDVLKSPWPVGRVDAILCINMIHVAPWKATEALLYGSGEALSSRCGLFLYGPYRRDGAHTAPSNEAFDAGLRARNPDWGVRDLEAVDEAAARAGLLLAEVLQMPANNLLVVFRRQP